MKFKTFITDLGEFGHITTDMFDNLVFYTSSVPLLLSEATTVKSLKKYYDGWHLDYLDDRGKFDWDKDFPKNWKLVEIEIKIIE